jgi:hypothetical protein
MGQGFIFNLKNCNINILMIFSQKRRRKISPIYTTKQTNKSIYFFVKKVTKVIPKTSLGCDGYDDHVNNANLH